MPLISDCLAVRGLGLRLPGVAGPEDLARLVGGASAPLVAVRRFEASHTNLRPAEPRACAPVEPRIPVAVAGRGLRALPSESLLALAVAAEAGAAATGDRPECGVGASLVDLSDAGPVAVVWASSSAGLAEYATICVEAAILDPGLSSPIIGPASAFNGPAASVSIRLGLDGPNETLTGGTTAGLTALIEAGGFVADGSATRALVGGSATVSRWSLAGLADDLVAAEGAACLAVRPWRNGEPGIRLGRFRRTSLDGSRLAAQCRDLIRAARTADGQPNGTPATGPPDRAPGGTPPEPVATIISALDADLVRAVADDHPRPVWHLERSLGDFGAAGGFMAVAGAVAYCASSPAPTSLLALAIEPSGNAAIMEVSSWGAPTSSSGW